MGLTDLQLIGVVKEGRNHPALFSYMCSMRGIRLISCAGSVQSDNRQDRAQRQYALCRL